MHKKRILFHTANREYDKRPEKAAEELPHRKRVRRSILQLFVVRIYTTPENPINAIASNPAVIKAIGVPFIPSGIFTRLICSRSPAKSTRARPKPIAVENAYTTPVSRS